MAKPSKEQRLEALALFSAGNSGVKVAQKLNISYELVKKSPETQMSFGAFLQLAEGEGFEPSIRHNRMPDFESGAFDHSATLPVIVRGYES